MKSGFPSPSRSPTHTPNRRSEMAIPGRFRCVSRSSLPPRQSQPATSLNDMSGNHRASVTASVDWSVNRTLIFRWTSLPRRIDRVTPSLPSAREIGEFTDGLVPLVRASEANEQALVRLGHVTAKKLPVAVLIMAHEQNRLTVSQRARRRICDGIVRIGERPARWIKTVRMLFDGIHDV